NLRGNLDRDGKRLVEARKDYEEALAIRRRLAKDNPAMFLADVAETLHDFGSLCIEEQRLDEARSSLAEAAGIYETLARTEPTRYAPRTALIRAALARIPAPARTSGGRPLK